MLLKLIPIWKPNPARSVRECQDHNRFEHSRLAASAGDFNRHMCRYVLNFTLDIGDPHFSAPVEWAGVAENWFYSAESFRDAFAEPDYALFREDEVRFADFSDLILVPALPVTIFGSGRTVPFKLFRAGWYRGEVEPSSARTLWEVEFAHAISHDRRLKPLLRGYVQNRPVPLAHSFPDTVRSADALDEYWIEDLDVLPELLTLDAEVRAETGFDELFDASRRVQVITESKLLWDMGEDPAVALARTRRGRSERMPA